ncbi:LLM class F420-dependent oxidoreductase [Nocardioides jishulii]|uniref:LLM class F420-dependent oxidoreductase n=1 Tax=Nocardioides jishulii TaxID=2575440 RepID=A0A4U2YKW5_9ACTN|nr:LLM class F420-dependent oxidoreductase [Nocardioides jishulii]QCX27291.1 LLM class F420-dependent oxidoreductase [Nocardioides jishulii]TKI61778.1 LLM class F420-dependent oxidoreductase [Nocardioides jishulii]
MRIGQQVARFTWPGSPGSIGPTFASMARWSEAAGVESLWVMDHFWQIAQIGPPEEEMLEAYTTLGFAAGVTSRIELGAMVTAATVRNPALLVKTVTTLDVLSGGRAWLGIGAAWFEEENRGYGLDFPPTAERFVRLEDTLRLSRQMWSGDDSPFVGEGFTAPRPLNVPQPVRTPPILIGGVGERKTLRYVAKYADATNIFDGGPDFVAQKLGVLRQHCEAEGRDYDEIRKTVLTRISLSERSGEKVASGEETMSLEQAVDKLGSLAEVGVDTAIIGMGNDTDQGTYDLLAQLVEHVASL